MKTRLFKGAAKPAAVPFLLLSLLAGPAAADTYSFCWRLDPSSGPVVGVSATQLRFEATPGGGSFVPIYGKASYSLVTYPPVAVTFLAYGTVTYDASSLEAMATASGVQNDQLTVSHYSLRLDPGTLAGRYWLRREGSETTESGQAVPVPCGGA